MTIIISIGNYAMSCQGEHSLAAPPLRIIVEGSGVSSTGDRDCKTENLLLAHAHSTLSSTETRYDGTSKGTK